VRSVIRSNRRKTTGHVMTPRELAIAKAAAATTMANIRAGLVYDVVRLAWVRREECP
jgi:hypothetical protein